MQYVKMKYIVIKDNIVKPDGHKGRKTVIDLNTGEHFLNELFHDLNTFCDKHRIPLEVNKERTWAVAEYLVGKKVPDDQSNRFKPNYLKKLLKKTIQG
jgi:hypothetical protein